MSPCHSLAEEEGVAAFQYRPLTLLEVASGSKLLGLSTLERIFDIGENAPAIYPLEYCGPPEWPKAVSV